MELGLSYARGGGVKRSDIAAVKWWEISASHGDPQALFLLGQAHEKGTGLQGKIDCMRAVNLFQESASYGYPPAAGALAELGLGDQ